MFTLVDAESVDGLPLAHTHTHIQTRAHTQQGDELKDAGLRGSLHRLLVLSAAQLEITVISCYFVIICGKSNVPAAA